MFKQLIYHSLLHWLVSSSGMWLCINLFASNRNPNDPWLFVAAGLIFSLLNTTVKPLIKILSLPLVIFTMGLFTLIINGALVAFTIWLIPGVEMHFGLAILSSVIMSAINGLVNFIIPSYNK